MNAKFIYSIIILGILLISCSKSKESEINPLKFQQTEFSQNWNSFNNSDTKIDEITYDSLKLGILGFLPTYENSDFFIDTVLLDTLNQKIIALKVVNSGEILEYLLTYQNNQHIDNLLVSYEDNVEYFGQTYSSLNGNLITMTTIEYNDESDNFKTKTDTSVSYYQITPTLQFSEIQ